MIFCANLVLANLGVCAKLKVARSARWAWPLSSSCLPWTARSGDCLAYIYLPPELEWRDRPLGSSAAIPLQPLPALYEPIVGVERAVLPIARPSWLESGNDEQRQHALEGVRCVLHFAQHLAVRRVLEP